ncbi:MAG: glycosyltransferase [Candidatus Cyclobacteriaceae bacterium M2_1C_046]
MEIIFYLFIATLGIQVIYLILAFSGIFRNYKVSAESQPVSVVIAARDELENLKELLPKIFSQGYADFEVILVDDKSEDGTEDWIRREYDSVVNFKYIRINTTPGHIHSKKYALTIAIKEAKNPVILLTDADCYPVSDQWIRSMASRYTGEKKIILGYSGYFSDKSFLNYFIRYETLLTGLQYLGWAGLGVPYMGVGRNLSYLKGFFKDKKGYKKYQSVTGGDDDLFVNQHANNSNTAFALGKEALTLSKPKESWGEFLMQKLRHLSVGRFYKRRHKFLLSHFSITQLVFWITFIILLFAQSELYFIGLGFLIRLVVISVTMAVASRRFGHPFNIAGVILLDFCYTFYYIFVGIAALFSRKVRWT